MGALNILDRNIQADHVISDAQLFARQAHESRLLETSEAFKRAHARWRDQLFQRNADTVAFYAIAGHMTQLASSPSNQPTFFRNRTTPNTGKGTWTKPKSKSSSNRRLLAKCSWPSRIDVSSKYWTTQISS